MAIVEDFEAVAVEIIKEAAAYAGAREDNADIASAIRQLRTVASAVLNALDSATAAQRRQPFIPAPPIPPPDRAPSWHGRRWWPPPSACLPLATH